MYKVADLGPKVRGDVVTFRLWLPGIEPDSRVLAVGSFCNWELENSVALKCDEKTEIWEGQAIEIPQGLHEYSFIVRTDSWESNQACDPFARMTGPEGMSAFMVPPEKPARLDVFYKPPLDELILYELELDNFNLDFEGTKKRIVNYLCKLGVNGVIFSPWVGTDRHRPGKRSVLHYFAPDYAYGMPYDLKVMINECHNAGIAVIMDIDLHGVSTEFGYNEMYSVFNKKPLLGRLDDSGDEIFLNYNEPATGDFVYQVCHWWLDEYNVDGFRFLNSGEYWDKADGEGLSPLCKRISDYSKKENEDIYLFASDCGAFDREMINTSHLRAVENRHFFKSIQRMAENRTLGGNFWKEMDANQLGFSQEKNMDGEKIRNSVINSIEDSKNHGLMVKMGVISGKKDRLGFPVGDRKNHWWKMKPFVIAQFTGSGIPVIFNGQEIGNTRFLAESGPGRYEPRPIEWHFLSDFAGKDLFGFHQKLIKLRKKYKSFKGWNFFHYFTDRENQVIAFKRYLDEESVIIAINFSNESCRVELEFSSDGIWRENLDDYKVIVEEKRASIKIPARYGVILTKTE